MSSEVITYNHLYLVFSFSYRKFFPDYLRHLGDLGALTYEHSRLKYLIFNFDKHSLYTYGYIGLNPWPSDHEFHNFCRCILTYYNHLLTSFSAKCPIVPTFSKFGAWHLKREGNINCKILDPTPLRRQKLKRN